MSGRLFGYGSSSASSHASGSRRRERVRQVNESLYEFHKPDCTPSIQIVFFHGIHLGNSEDAHLDPWEREDGSFWPQNWLPEAFPGAHIFTATYSGGVGKGSQRSFDLYLLAENLLADMMQAEIGLLDCPVVLVGYCFGGIVIKELCLQACKPNRSQGNTFLNNIRGIFYYGTPHQGFPFLSNQVDFSESPLLGDLKILSTEAARRKYEFENLRELCAKWRIHGIGESLPTNSELFPNIVAVPEASARDGPFFNIVAADHISITKPTTEIDRRYSVLKDLLHSIAKTFEEETKVGKEVSTQGARPENFQHLPKQMIHMDVEKGIVSKLETVRILGLVGMGGLGKSTLARAVFNTLIQEPKPKFDYSCFVPELKLINGREEDMREELWKCLHFQGKKVGGAPNLSMLRGKSLLLVLDDVSRRDIMVLLDLAEDADPASRFIWTSRERDLLKDVGDLHEVPVLNEDHAKLLFMNHAFPEPAVPPSELETSVQDIVKRCDGLPLALEVVGKYLRGEGKPDFWKQTLSALEKAQKVKDLQRLWAKLRLSFDSLTEHEKQVFLDATNFFSGNENWTLSEAKLAWSEAYGPGELLWQTLVNKSLVYDVKEQDRIRVHEQLQSLGRMIASEPDHIGKYQVLTYEAVDGAVRLKMVRTSDVLHEEGVHALRVVFTNTDDYRSVNSAALQISLPLHNLKKLRFLDIDWPIQIAEVKGIISLPTQLVLLRCASPDLLLNPGLENHLAILHLSLLKYVPSSFRCSFGQFRGGSLQSLPESFGQLRALQFYYCESLQSLPESFGQLSALQDLQFYSCESLQRLPESFGQLRALRNLQFEGCRSLQRLPESFGQLGALRNLQFEWCGSLQSLPESFGQLRALRNLHFDGCRSLQRLPESFGQLNALQDLQFCGCESLQSLPESFGQLGALRNIQFKWCGSLQSLPESFGQLGALQNLQFEGCRSLQRLPESFGQLGALQNLQFKECRSLQRLPESFGQLCALQDLQFYSCESLQSLPESFGQLGALRNIQFEWCGSLQRLPESFGQLGALRNLQFEGCRSLQSLPESFGQLGALQNLQFEGCRSLQRLPESFGQLSALQDLQFYYCESLQSLPESLGQLSALQDLQFYCCESLRSLPESFGQLGALRNLQFEGCRSLQRLPESFGQLGALRNLEFEWCGSLQRLPESFGQLSALQDLQFYYCESLQSSPESFGELGALRNLQFNRCKLLRSLSPSYNSMLGEQLYPLVDKLEHDHAGKVTGMLLEMDQTEVLHLPANVLTEEVQREVSNVALDKIETPSLPRSALEHGFKRFINKVVGSDARGYFVSKVWFLRLDKHHREEVMSVLRGAGYFEIYQTRTTMFYERLDDDMQEEDSDEEDEDSNGESTMVETNEASIPKTNDALSSGNGIVEEASVLKNAIETSPKTDAKCECIPRVLTVTCTTPTQIQIQPSTSSQGQCNVTTSGSGGLTISTRVDKDISIEQFSLWETSGNRKVDLPLNVSAEACLSCCVTSDHTNLRIEFLEIKGEIGFGDSFDRRSNACVLRSVRTNVDALIKNSIASPPLYFFLDIKKDSSYKWRRVLQDCRPYDKNGQRKDPEDLTWLELTGKRPKHSRPGSKTLELRYHVQNILKVDIDEDSHQALILYFEGNPPVKFEGKFPGGLYSNSFLELHVRYQVEISYVKDCSSPSQDDDIFVCTTRENKVIEFDSVLKLTTQKLSSQG